MKYKICTALELIEKYSVYQNNMNIIMGCDFNEDISNYDNIKNQLQTINMKIVQNLNVSTFKIGNKNHGIGYPFDYYRENFTRFT